jgi:hypothetical protein
VGNGLLTAMSLRPRVREPTIRTRTPKPRAWGLSLNGKGVRFLGFVEATDREAAKTAVADALSHKQRKRLVVHELPGRVKAVAVSALDLNGEPSAGRAAAQLMMAVRKRETFPLG